MKRVLLALVLLVAACGGGGSKAASTATTTSSAVLPTAVAVLNGMKAAGASFDADVSDLTSTIDRSSEYEKFMQSSARTSSENLNVDLEVWDTPDHRNAARLFIISTDSSPLALVECGPAMLSVLANTAAQGEAVRDRLKPVFLSKYSAQFGC
jgi:hypothetical protein